MAKPSLANMSVEGLLQLRSDVTLVLQRKAKELTKQLSRLGEEVGARPKQRDSALKGRKVPAKYRDRSGNTWAGRGAARGDEFIRERWLGKKIFKSFGSREVAKTRALRMAFGRLKTWKFARNSRPCEIVNTNLTMQLNATYRMSE